MKITELYEGAEPRLPGAVSGISIMTPHQFTGVEDEQEGLAEDGGDPEITPGMKTKYGTVVSVKGNTVTVKASNGDMTTVNIHDIDQGVAEGEGNKYGSQENWDSLKKDIRSQYPYKKGTIVTVPHKGKLVNGKIVRYEAGGGGYSPAYVVDIGEYESIMVEPNKVRQEVDEATALPAQSRELGGQEFQDYMGRIKGTDDVDKKTGQIKLDKKGNEKYVTGKTKTDKYKMPYMHRSSVIEYYDEAGKRFKEEAVIEALKTRPKKLLKQNEKMKHSNGDLEQFFNVGFAALTGVAVDEATNKLIIVNTCPGAGSCKVDCFAMKGGKVQFKAAWLSDGRILTFLLNDPSGFFQTLSSEISKEEQLGKKGGYAVTIRWHDAGDFFSPEYLDLALNMAAQHPDVKFYAYTKMAGAALGQKPPNFIINWSEGANTSQEKQVKAQDPTLATTKNSRIVPENLFYDLLAKDAKGNLAKGAAGQWQVASPEALGELKQRLATAYGISTSSILSYDEYMAKGKTTGLQYNVIVAPGEGDLSANDPGVLSTLLLRH